VPSISGSHDCGAVPVGDCAAAIWAGKATKMANAIKGAKR